MFGLFYPWGIILQAIAIVHFVRRRPDGFWLWVILIGGGLGALVYIAAEMIPDARLLGGTLQVFPRRKRIRQLEALVVENPSIGNYEELGDLLLDDGQHARARECFDRVLAQRPDSIDPLYRRGLAFMAMNQWQAAADDFARVVALDPRYDYHRAAGLLAHALAQAGRHDQAEARFAEVTQLSTLNETEYNYASFLGATGRHAEAREWAQRVLNRKHTMPGFARRRDRPWFRRAAALVKRLPAA
jgi:hypothetical protein